MAAPDELRKGVRRPVARKKSTKPTTTPTRYVAAPKPIKQRSKPTTRPTRYVAAPRGSSAGSTVGKTAKALEPLHRSVAAAKAGHPFNPRHVKQAIALGLASANGLRVDDNGNIQHKIKRSLLGVDSALSDYEVVLDPRKGGAEPVKTAAHHAGVDAAGVKILEQTVRPAHAIAGLVQEGPKGFEKGLIENKPYSFGQALKKIGAPNVVAGVGGFVLDVAADPTTYVSAGTISLARKSALKAAEDATKNALKRGASQRLAEHEARQAAKRAVEQAAPGKGLVVKFGKHEVPGVTRSTATAARKVKRVAAKSPKVVKRTAAGTKNVARDVRPQIRPAGVLEAEHVAVRHAGRKARASARMGIDDKTARAHGLARELSPEDHSLVIHALEHDDIASLPERLHGVANFLKAEYADTHLTMRRAGIPVGTIDKYHPHARKDKLEAGEGIVEDTRMPTTGPRTVGSHSRGIKKTLAEANAEHRAKHGEDLFSTNVPLVYANYMRDASKKIAIAHLARDLGQAGEHIRVFRDAEGRKVAHIRDLGPDEAIYHVGVRDDKFGIHKVPASQVGKQKGRYVILNEKLVNEQLDGIAHGSQRTAIGSLFDRGTSGFKRVATFTPGFHARNLVGDTQMAYLAQPGHRLPANAKAAGSALRRLSEVERAQTKKLGKVAPSGKAVKIGKGRMARQVPVDDFVAEARRHGVIRSGYIGRELEELKGVGKDVGRVGKGARKERVKRWMQNREDLMRLATYKHGLDSGMSPAEAADLSLHTHIDYGDLSHFERHVARRAMPFYTFSARALPIHAKALVQRPGKFASYEKLREEAATATGLDLQDSQKDLKTFQARQAPLIMKFGGKTVVISDALPLTILNELPASGLNGKYLDELAQWFGQLANPLFKDPVELYANRSFFFRSDIEPSYAPTVAAPSLIAAAIYKHDRALADRLGIVPDYIDKKTGKKTWGWRGKTDYIFKSVPGLLNFTQQLLTEGTNRRGMGTAAKVGSFVGGVKVEPLDPTGAALEILFKTRDALEKQANAYSRRAKTPANIKAAAELRARQKEAERQIHELSVRRGDTTPIYASSAGARSTVGLDTKIAVLNKQADAMKAKRAGQPGAAEDEYGYQTQEYAQLLSELHGLREERAARRQTGTKAKTIKRRPQTATESRMDRFDERLSRIDNSDDAARERFNKRMERLKVRGGG